MTAPLETVVPFEPRGEDEPRPLRAVGGAMALRARWIEAVAFDPRFTDIERVIAIGMAARYVNRSPDNDRFGTAYVAAARLAAELDAGERTVRRALHRLHAGGYLEIIKPGGGIFPTVYRLTLPAPQPCRQRHPSPASPPAAPQPCRQRHPSPAASGTPALPLAAPQPCR